ncbi:MAG: hypothetical protein DSY76_04710 [Bacteroidetes bacterium]|nr:MAG: hypothetical protein DSY76_04710 [Bacteroidota bacterium]
MWLQNNLTYRFQKYSIFKDYLKRYVKDKHPIFAWAKSFIVTISLGWVYKWAFVQTFSLCYVLRFFICGELQSQSLWKIFLF